MPAAMRCRRILGTRPGSTLKVRARPCGLRLPLVAVQNDCSLDQARPGGAHSNEGKEKRIHMQCNHIHRFFLFFDLSAKSSSK
jgi:hypothetical protein